MKRTLITGALVVSLIVSLVACGLRQEGENGPASSIDGYADRRITQAQMLSDYDNMWAAMQESYPFWGVLARNNPENPSYFHTVIADYRKQIEDMEAKDDEAMNQFLSIVANSLYDVCGTVGHVSIVNPNYFQGLDVYRKYADEMPEVQPWVDVIEQPEVIAFYEYYDYLLTLLPEDAPEEESNSEEEKEQQDTVSEEANLTTQTLEEGKTAYLRVNSFDDDFMESDLPTIRAFFQQVKDYENLIIDMRENGGGNTVYWEDGFVRPNITQPVTSRLVRLMKDTQLTRQFYGTDYQRSQWNVETVVRDPKYTQLPKEDLQGLSLARALTETIEPETNQKLFDGKIWVLIGPAVYSSAEAFAVFCKDTGFATLVGQTTGGSDSGGPILFELPESHVLVQFDVEYCINADGSCNQELGTAPDIEADDALAAAINAISRDDLVGNLP